MSIAIHIFPATHLGFILVKSNYNPSGGDVKLKYYRLANSIGDVCLSVETGEGILENLTSIEDDVTDILDLIKASSITGESIDDIARKILDSGNSEKIDTDIIITDNVAIVPGRLLSEIPRISNINRNISGTNVITSLVGISTNAIFMGTLPFK